MHQRVVISQFENDSRHLLLRTFTAYQRLVQFSRLYATRKRKEKKVQCWLPEPNVDGARTRVLSRTKNGMLFRSRQRVTVVKGWQDQSAQKQRSYEVATTDNGNKEQRVMEKWDIEKQKGKITLAEDLFHVQTLLSYFLSLKRDFSSKVCGRFSLIDKE